MSGSKEKSLICKKCGKYPFELRPHVCSAKEPLDGSPLESVVQGRLDSPVPSNPDVQGTPDILAELRARASRIAVAAEEQVDKSWNRNTVKYAIDNSYMRLSKAFISWIDELKDAKQQHSTRHEVE